MFFLDTSVLTPYYCPEERSTRVQHLLSRIDRPIISPLVEIELYCVTARKVRSGEISKSTGQRIFTEFKRHVAEGRFDVVPIEAGEYAFARRCIEEMSTLLRAVDALHLATAAAHDIVLITADRDLAQAAKRFGVKYKFIP
jgi:predicted nucleic acid-binding protein